MPDCVSCPFCVSKVTRPGFPKHFFSKAHLLQVKEALIASAKQWSHTTSIVTSDDALAYWMKNPKRLPHFTLKGKVFNICFGCKHVYLGDVGEGQHSCKFHEDHLKKFHGFMTEKSESVEEEVTENISLASCIRIDELQTQLEALKAENTKLQKKNERLEKENDQLGESLEDDEKYVTIVNRLLSHPLFEGKSVEELEEDLKKVDDGEYILKLVRAEEAPAPAPAPSTERRVGPDFVNRQDGMFISQMKAGDAERIAEPVPEVKIWSRNMIVQSPPQHNPYPAPAILGSTRGRLPKKAAAIFPATHG